MKKRNIFFSITISLILSCLLAGFIIASVYYLRLVSSSEKVTSYKQNEYLRFQLYGSTWDNDISTVSGQFRIVDAMGNELSMIERSWPGTYLAIEFTILNIDNNEYLFPSCIYGKNRIYEGRSSIEKGTSLEKYYTDNKKCLLPGIGGTAEEKSNLYRLAKFANSDLPTFVVGSRRTYTVDLSKCKTGCHYSLIYREGEGFIIQQL